MIKECFLCKKHIKEIGRLQKITYENMRISVCKYCRKKLKKPCFNIDFK
jgi:ribosome-binding protein aMBF1 (putative translation factor)